ncbi:MAG TPA: holin, partial [Acinetobacter venetianus]|nr:holin [Acinetobacter venetianus]HIQ36197.1 holin [Acinetobacter venetianus]
MSENSAVEASAVAISQKVTATSGVSSFVGFA